MAKTLIRYYIVTTYNATGGALASLITVAITPSHAEITYASEDEERDAT